MSDDLHPMLFLLPGLDGTGSLFRPLLRALPSEVRASAISYPPDRRLSLSEYAALVAQQLPRDEVTLLAESFSGLVALTLLSQSELRIKRVLFVAAFAKPPRPMLLRAANLVPWAGSIMHHAPDRLLRQACLGGTSDDEELTLVREALAAVSSRVLAHRLRLISQTSAFEAARFGVPCHYLRAREDRLIPDDAADWFREHFEMCDVETLAGPHMILQVQPQVCAQWIVDKLAEP